MGSGIIIQLKRKLVLWREQESFMDVINWPIKILSFVSGPMVVVFAVHDLKVPDEPILYKVLQIFLLRSWWNWWSFFPVIFWLLVKKGEFSLAVRGGFVNVFELICVLLLSTILVEELLVLCVVVGVIFGKCHMCPIIPRRHIFHSGRFTLSGAKFWQLGVVMSKHKLLRNFMDSTIWMRI